MPNCFATCGVVMFAIDKELCTACGECKDCCPCDAITEHDEGYSSIDPDLCADCGACLDVCEFGAIFEYDPSQVIPHQ